MNSAQRRWLGLAGSVACVLAILAYAFVANEARKEVYFLCGNFRAGVTEGSVLRQLDTIYWSRYRSESNRSGTTIIHGSRWHLDFLRCTIEVDRQGLVVSAEYT